MLYILRDISDTIDALTCGRENEYTKKLKIKSSFDTLQQLYSKDFIKEEDGMGTVEVILIIVVLISLVVIFKEQLTKLVESIFEKIVKQANSI